MLSNFAVRLLSLITMPILTSLLSPSAYGVAAMAATGVSLLSVFAIAGMDVSYVRSFQSNAFADGNAVESYAWRFALAGGLTAGLVVTVSWGFLSRAFDLPGYLIVFIAAGIVASVAQTMSLVKARLANRYAAISTSIVIAGIATAICSIAIAYFWRRDEFALVVAMLLTSLIPVAILGVPRLKQLFRPSGLSASERSKVLHVGLAAILSAPAYWIMSSSDRWFLAYFDGPGSVGIYSISYSVAIMGMMVNSAILPVWTTEAIREVEANSEQGAATLGKVAERFFAVLLIVWLAITAAGGDLISFLAAPDFHSAKVVIPFISLAVLFHGVIHIASGIFIITNKLRHTIWWWLSGSAICFILNLILIPQLGITGAAISQAVSFAFVAIGLMAGSSRFYSMDIRWSRLIIFGAVSVLSAFAMAPAWSSLPLVSLLMKIPVGLLVFLLGVRLFMPNILQLLRK